MHGYTSCPGFIGYPSFYRDSYRDFMTKLK